MSELIKINLGSLSAVGTGWPVQGQAGAATATATVQGAGSVSATVVVRGSNDGVAWATLATLSPSGAGAAMASGNWSGDYAMLRMDVTALSAGARVGGVVAVDQTGAASSQPAGGGMVPGFPAAVGADGFGRRSRRMCKLFGVPNESTTADTFGATAGSGVTFHDRVELESRATRVALIYGNTAATPQTLTGVKAFTHQDFTNELANEVIGSFASVTFSGAASVTIPAGSTGQASMVVSDWINLQDNPRLDGVQRTNLHVRTLWATPAGNEPITSLNRAGAVWTSSPRVSKTSYQAGNRLTSAMAPAAGTSAESRTVLMGVLYEIRGKGMTIMLIGDSTTSGYFGPTSGVRRRPWVHRLALALSTPANPVDFVVCGIGGENVPSYCGMAEKLFALGVRPSLVFLHTLSPNIANIGGYSGANVADIRGWVTRIMDQVEGMGGCTVLLNGAPASNLGLTNDNTRKSLNNQWVDYDQAVLDIDSLLSNGATPALLQSEYSEDGIHYSEAGDAAVESLARPLVESAMGAYFR